MNYKFVLNAILVIVILHFVLSFFLKNDYEEEFVDSSNKTNNDDKENKEERDDKEPIVKEVSEDTEDFTSMKTELSKYINSPLKDEPYNSIRPANYHGTTENSANFNSNVMDLNPFFKQNMEDPTVESERLRMVTTHNKKTLKNHANVDITATQPGFTNHTTQVRFHPENWTYEKESVINGGMFGNLLGYDDLETQYAIYDPSANQGQKSALINKEDDLRFGMGVPQKRRTDD